MNQPTVLLDASTRVQTVTLARQTRRSRRKIRNADAANFDPKPVPDRPASAHPEIRKHNQIPMTKPSNTPFKASTAPPTPSKGKRPKRPPTPFEAAAKKRLTNFPDYDVAHKLRDEELQKHVEKPRKGSMALPIEIQDQLEPGAAKFLYAANNHARIAFAKIATKRVRKLVKNVGKDTQFFFVTLAPKKYAVPFHEAADFNIEKLKAWARQRLEGRNFIGMVEAAHYPNLGLVQGRTNSTISWHVHLIVWGIREFELKAIVNVVNAREEPLIPFKRPAHCKPRTHEEIEGQILYMLKAPMKEHFVYQKSVEVLDKETGVITIAKTNRWKQKKRPYRRLGLAKMTVVLAKQRLDRLMFAGGEGKAVYEAIRSEALKPLMQHEQRHRPRVARSPARKPRK